VTQNNWAAVFRVDEFGEENVKGTTDWVKCEEASVFGESEEGESDAEGERGESGLRGKIWSAMKERGGKHKK